MKNGRYACAPKISLFSFQIFPLLRIKVNAKHPLRVRYGCDCAKIHLSGVEFRHKMTYFATRGVLLQQARGLNHINFEVSQINSTFAPDGCSSPTLPKQRIVGKATSAQAGDIQTQRKSIIKITYFINFTLGACPRWRPLQGESRSVRNH